ncbi:MAG: ECF transporter S component [Eubacterium sp.]|nr:ECF transporter S component [Eubacterium sp.]
MDGSMYTERNKELNARSQVYELVLTGLMAALVMAATSFFKIPVPATNGYVHLGDAFVFLSVLILGRRNGTLAAATGSGLADLIGGYAHWVPWTFAIKGLMAFAFGTILIVINKRTGNAGSSETEMQRSTGLLTASAMALSSLIMIAGYFTAQRIIYGNFAAPLAALPGNIAQAAAGVLIAELASTALRKTAPQLIRK